MKDYNKLNEDFIKKVSRLQKRCRHKNISEWMDEWWAYGHSTGMCVKQCKMCKKIVGRKALCDKCGKETEEFSRGNGTNKFPYAGFYCKECLPYKPKEKWGYVH